MKKLLICLLLLPSLAWGEEPIEIARMNPYVLGAGVAAASSCTTEQQASDGLTTTARVDDGTTTGYSHSFTANADYCLCKAIVDLRKQGSPAYDVLVELWSATSGAPSSKLADLGTVSVSSIQTGSRGEFTVTPETCYNLTNGTQYAIVLRASSGSGDGSNYVYTYYSNDSTSPTQKYYKNYSSWTVVDSDSIGEYKLYR